MSNLEGKSKIISIDDTSDIVKSAGPNLYVGEIFEEYLNDYDTKQLVRGDIIEMKYKDWINSRYYKYIYDGCSFSRIDWTLPDKFIILDDSVPYNYWGGYEVGVNFSILKRVQQRLDKFLGNVNQKLGQNVEFHFSKDGQNYTIIHTIPNTKETLLDSVQKYYNAEFLPVIAGGNNTLYH